MLISLNDEITLLKAVCDLIHNDGGFGYFTTKIVQDNDKVYLQLYPDKYNTVIQCYIACSRLFTECNLVKYCDFEIKAPYTSIEDADYLKIFITNTGKNSDIDFIVGTIAFTGKAP